MARVGYLILFFTNVVVAAFLHEFGKNVLSHVSSIFSFFSQCESLKSGSYCIGNQLVYRLSFSIGSFFALTGLLTTIIARCCDTFCSFLCIQVPCYLLLVAGSLFLPKELFDNYSMIARISSGAFIVLQTVIIIDWAYSLRDYFLTRIEASNGDEAQALLSGALDEDDSIMLWKAGYLSVVVILFAISIAALTVAFQVDAGCNLNLSFLVVTILISIAVTVVSVLTWVNVGLLPAAAVVSNLVLLCCQALRSNPDSTCITDPQSWFVSTQQSPNSVVMNAILAACAITWTSWQTSATKTHLLSTGSPLSNGETEEKKHTEIVPEYQFHALMLLSSFYMAMTLTNWGSSDDARHHQDAFVSTWVCIISQWLVAALFLWTLIAPTIFPDRVFA